MARGTRPSQEHTLVPLIGRLRPGEGKPSNFEMIHLLQRHVIMGAQVLALKLACLAPMEQFRSTGMKDLAVEGERQSYLSSRAMPHL